MGPAFRDILMIVKKKIVHLALLGMMTLGIAGQSWGQANCLTAMSQVETCCCSSGDNASRCPAAPAEKSECPMLKEASNPILSLTPAKLIVSVEVISFGTVAAAEQKPRFSVESVDPDLSTVRLDLLSRQLPLLRAPPVSSLTA